MLKSASKPRNSGQSCFVLQRVQRTVSQAPTLQRAIKATLQRAIKAALYSA